MPRWIPKGVCRAFYSKGDCNTVKKLSWSQLWTVQSCKSKAWDETRKRYPSWSFEDGRGDAFRHSFWSALMTRDLGLANAKYVGDQHENLQGGNDPDRKAMDLHNNHLGRQIALKRPKASDKVLADACAQAIKKGRARIIAKTKAAAERRARRDQAPAY